MRSKVRLIAQNFFLSIVITYQYGFSQSYPNTAYGGFRNFINESYTGRSVSSPPTDRHIRWYWNIFLNSWFVGYFIGLMITPQLSDRFGRKVALIIGNTISLFASTLRCLSIFIFVPELLIVGRVFASLSSAIAYSSLVLFLQETSPTQLRGQLTSLSEVSFAITCLVGMVLGMDVLLGQYPIVLLATAFVPGVIAMIAIMPFPETPRFLLLTSRDRPAAIRSLIFYQGGHLANANEILAEIEKEHEDDNDMDSSATTTASFCSFTQLLDALRRQHVRRALLLSLAAMQLCAPVWPIFFLSSELLRLIGIENKFAEMTSSAMIAAYTVGTLSCAAVVERVGRRKLVLIFGTVNNACLCSFTLFAALRYIIQIDYFCSFALLLYGYTYGVALGPITFFIAAELTPQQERASVLNAVYSINTIMGAAISFAILPVYECWRGYTFVPFFIIPSTICLIFLYRYLPETKSKEIYQIVYELKCGRATSK